MGTDRIIHYLTRSESGIRHIRQSLTCETLRSPVVVIAHCGLLHFPYLLCSLVFLLRLLWDARVAGIQGGMAQVLHQLLY